MKKVNTTFNFEDYQNCLQTNEIILRSKQKFNNEVDNKFTLKFRKIKLRFKVDKRQQSLLE